MKKSLLFIVLLISCTDTYTDIQKLIYNEIDQSNENVIVLLISENNCISCFSNSLYSWIDYSDSTGYPIFSIFLHKENYSIEFNELINNTKTFILWKDTKSLELFEKLSKTTKQYSPFVVIIKNNKIDYIDKLIPAEYYINTKDEKK